jgi:hypothetical protein
MYFVPHNIAVSEVGCIVGRGLIVEALNFPRMEHAILATREQPALHWLQFSASWRTSPPCLHKVITAYSLPLGFPKESPHISLTVSLSKNITRSILSCDSENAWWGPHVTHVTDDICCSLDSKDTIGGECPGGGRRLGGSRRHCHPGFRPYRA